MKLQQSTDAETGEWNQGTVCFDQETGEMFDYRFLANPPGQNHDVPVPEAYRRQQRNEAYNKRWSPRKSCVQREITLGYNPTHKLFLIPSLFLFFRVTALVLLFCELVLHIWAHRVNSSNKDETIFYRSPLHLITSQFCAKCTSQVEMKKLSLIQDRRREAKQLIAWSGSVQ